MEVLEVPYRAQVNQYACGLAAFEMALRYVGKKGPFSQVKYYKKLAETEPHGSGTLRVTTEHVVALAKNRGLSAAWGRVSPEIQELSDQLRYFLHDQKLPLIACQRKCDDEPHLGHFRVIVGLDRNEVVFHDPCPRSGGRALRCPLGLFRDQWAHTGANVTGGVALWLAKQVPQNDSLEPGFPNRWIDPPDTNQDQPS